MSQLDQPQTHTVSHRGGLLTAGLALLACVGGYLTLTLADELRLALRLLLWGSLALLLLWALGLLFSRLLELVATALTRMADVLGHIQRLRLELRTLNAAARKAERDAELTIITAPRDHQVYIADTGHAVHWAARHLDARVYSNGPLTHQPPNPAEWTAWHSWHSRSLPGTTAALAALDAAAGLPQQVELLDLLPTGRGSLRNIVLGMRLDERGQPAVVSAPLYRLCHIGVAGATDSGKSNFGRAIAYQVFTAAESVQVVVSDLKGTTFKAFHDSPRLLYPIIPTAAEFVAVMAELYDEMQRRKALFQPYPTVETLADYNRLSDTPLPVIAIFVDEVSNLFMDKATQEITLAMLREARAFGLYFAAMGQSWSHRELSPSLRQQFRTGLHFGTNDPASSRMIVNSSAAVKLMTPGRALASLPFGLSGGVVELQTPYLDAATTLLALAEFETPATAALRPLPEPATSAEAAEDTAFRELVSRGLSRREAALNAYGKEYAGAIVTRGKRALGEI